MDSRQAEETKESPEPVEKRPARSAFSKVEILSIAIAMLSMFVAATSAFYARQLGFERINLTSIDALHREQMQWTQIVLAHPYLAHLLTPTDEYWQDASLVEESLGGLDRAELAARLLQEELAAESMFSLYERVVSEHHLAAALGDPTRLELLETLLVSFDDQHVNPRLSHLLMNDLGTEVQLTKKAQARLEGVLAKATAKDELGPIGRAYARASQAAEADEAGAAHEAHGG